VELPVPLATGVTDAGVSVQITVALTGAIAQVNPTAELKLFKEVTVTFEFIESPATTVPETGNALRLKSLTIKV
jgi:hypothetical protein